jgi:ornithine cyclodeaminase/alanine dehydrogenase
MVVSIGSTVPERREVDAEVVRRADVIVADVPDEIANETGDMIAAREAGVAFDDKIVSLAEVVQGRVNVKQTPGNIVLFKSVGSGLQDIRLGNVLGESGDRGRRHRSANGHLKEFSWFATGRTKRATGHARTCMACAMS